MFGSLFEEEEEGFSLAPSGGRVVKGEGEPPPPRGRVNLSGIKNQGGTCYLNSLLQTLLFTPEFREELFSLGPKELGCLEDKDKPEAKVKNQPCQGYSIGAPEAVCSSTLGGPTECLYC